MPTAVATVPLPPLPSGLHFALRPLEESVPVDRAACPGPIGLPSDADAVLLRSE